MIKHSKNNISIFLATMLLTTSLTAPLEVHADISQTNDTNSRSMTDADKTITDTWGSAPVSFNSTDGTLTVSPGTIAPYNYDSTVSTIGTKINKTDVKKIIFEPGVKAPVNSSYLLSAVNNKWTSLTTIQGSLDTSNVSDMSYMFYGSKVASLDLSNFNTANVTDMSYMFAASIAPNLDLSNFNTANVANMSNMFRSSKVTSLNLSNFDTSNVTNMNYMFYGSKVPSPDLSSFNTANVTNMHGMFMGSTSTDINVSSFNTANVTDMNSMFFFSKVTSLDLSSFNTAKVTDMNNMFYNAAVNTLKVGEKSILNGSVNLKENITSPYTGRWVRLSPQEPVAIYDSSADFITDYNGTKVGTYVREKSQAEAVTVNYQDADGNKIADPKTVSGYVDDSYDVSTSEYKKDIPGYTYKEVKGNTTGTFSDQAVTVTYVYTRNQAEAVTVNYQDADGNKIADPKTVSGYVGDSYDVSTSEYKKDIPGYTYKEVKGNTTGTFSDQAVTVTYVYTRSQAEAVTVNYQDADGNKIADPKTVSGYVGDSYDVSTSEYKKDIPGYTYKEVKGNTTGTFSDQAVTVTYVYTRSQAEAVTVNYQDADGNKIADPKTVSGYVDDSYDVSTSEYKKDIPGYTYKEVKGNTTGTFSDQAATVTYVYTRNQAKAETVSSLQPGTRNKSVQNIIVNNKNLKQKTAESDTILPKTGTSKTLSMLTFVIGVLVSIGIFILKKLQLRNN